MVQKHTHKKKKTELDVILPFICIQNNVEVCKQIAILAILQGPFNLLISFMLFHKFLKICSQCVCCVLINPVFHMYW
jgi:hypothetical protein